MAFVKLSSMPAPPKLRVSSVQNLKGGLNIHDLAWQIKSDQSPEMKNMWWRDGVLQSRPGLTAYNNGMIVAKNDTGTKRFTGVPAYPHEYNGWYVMVNPNRLGTDRGAFVAVSAANPQYYTDIHYMYEGKSTSVSTPGTFFVYNGMLYYKSLGVYIRFVVSNEVDADTGLWRLEAEEVEGYIPTTYINAKPCVQVEGEPPNFGGGDAYQPVNRLSVWRSITYNFSADDLYICLPELYDARYAAAEVIQVTYLTASGAWAYAGIGLSANDTVFQLGDRTLIALDDTLRSKLGEEGTLSATNNVRVTYRAWDYDGSNVADVRNSLMDCDLAVVYGGGAGLCVVMAGCNSQPNAYFWSGNTNVAMDPTYFPVENYNLAGDVSDPITAFGKQQNMLVIFQERQIGRTVFATTEIDGRVFITMDYTVINPQMGCDVPNSVQLIENNLVFANTKFGVMFIKDTSSAYENNIVNISYNVEASRTAPGILFDIGILPKAVTSIDDGKRYWLCANGHVWIWDYSLGGSATDAKSLAWFYFDAVATPCCWLGLDLEFPMYVGRDGYLREFKTTVIDTLDGPYGRWSIRGEDFEKILALPIQDFNTYEVLKNVEKAIFVVKSSGDSTTDIEYETDYGTRKDLTPIATRGTKTWVPRDLTKGRALVFTKFAVTAVRKPRCIHVRHFLVRLRNSSRSEAISFISAQIYYTLQGVDR